MRTCTIFSYRLIERVPFYVVKPFLQSRNYFCQTPENESEVDMMIWNLPMKDVVILSSVLITQKK